MNKTVTLVLVFLFSASTFFGQQWAKMNTTSTDNLFAIDFVNDSTGYMSTSGGKIFKTTNWAVTWNEVYAGAGKQLNNIFFATPDTGYAVGQVGHIVKTTDAGATWTVQTGSSNLYGLYFTSSTTGYACGTGGVLLKTTDGGTSWNPLTSPCPGFHLNSIYFTDKLTGYVGGYQGVYKTTNAGSTWTPIVASISVVKLYFLNSQVGFASCDLGLFIKTTDGGTTWTSKQATPNSASLTGIHFINASTGYLCGNNTLLKTKDGGTTWTNDDAFGNSGTLYDIEFTNDSIGYMSGQGGNFYKTIFGGGPLGVDVGPDLTLCGKGAKANTTVHPTIYGGKKPYKVYLNNNLLSSYTDSVTLSTNGAGNKYELKVIDANNTISKDSLTVDTYTIPIISLGKDTVLCKGDTITLDAGTSGQYFYWEPTFESTQTIAAGDTVIYIAWVYTDYCDASDTIHIAGCDTTIITSASKNIPSQGNIVLYPDPASDHVNIQVENYGPVNISLMNTLGQLIPVEVQQNGNTFIVSLNSLSRGSYIIRMTSAGETTYRKFIKD